MLADIIEGTDGTIAVADAEQVLAGDGEGEIVARFLQLRYVAGKLPGPRQQAVLLDPKDIRIGVIVRVQRADRFDGLVYSAVLVGGIDAQFVAAGMKALDAGDHLIVGVGNNEGH